jgi:hypothetical protein
MLKDVFVLNDATSVGRIIDYIIAILVRISAKNMPAFSKTLKHRGSKHYGGINRSSAEK